MSYFICCRVTSVYSHLSSLEMQQYIVNVSVCFMSSFSRNICCLVSLTSCKIKRLVPNINKRILYAGFADQLLIMSKTVWRITLGECRWDSLWTDISGVAHRRPDRLWLPMKTHVTQVVIKRDVKRTSAAVWKKKISSLNYTQRKQRGKCVWYPSLLPACVVWLRSVCVVNCKLLYETSQAVVWNVTSYLHNCSCRSPWQRLASPSRLMSQVSPFTSVACVKTVPQGPASALSVGCETGATDCCNPRRRYVHWVPIDLLSFKPQGQCL